MARADRLDVVEKEFSCMVNFYVIVFSVYIYFLLQASNESYYSHWVWVGGQLTF